MDRGGGRENSLAFLPVAKWRREQNLPAHVQACYFAAGNCYLHVIPPPHHTHTALPPTLLLECGGKLQVLQPNVLAKFSDDPCGLPTARTTTVRMLDNLCRNLIESPNTNLPRFLPSTCSSIFVEMISARLKQRKKNRQLIT